MQHTRTHTPSRAARVRAARVYALRLQYGALGTSLLAVLAFCAYMYCIVATPLYASLADHASERADILHTEYAGLEARLVAARQNIPLEEAALHGFTLASSSRVVVINSGTDVARR